MRHIVSAVAIHLLMALPGLCHSQGYTTEQIIDPAFNMKAYDVSVPSGWSYQGSLMQGDSCSNLPSPVWRAYSPDGLSEFRRLPRFDWSWSNSPYAPKPKGDCLPLQTDVTAVQFIARLGAILGLHPVGDMPEPDFARAFLQNIENDNSAIRARVGQSPFRGSASAGRFETQNGTFAIEVQIRAGVRCSHQDLPGLARDGKLFQETCGAEVRIVRAPKGKLEPLLASLNAHGGFRENPGWTQKLVALMQQQMAVNAQQTQNILAARQAQFQHDQAVRAQQNAQYQAAVQAGYDRHNAREAQDMEARHTPASDWVDYALDQQTVTGTGGVAVKVSGAYSQTWANGQGQYFQTNDPNANPNNILPGTWTAQVAVHGNGSR